MAYETGASTGPNDLLDKFRLFAIAQGWTVNRWATVGSGRELCIAKGSGANAAFFNFRSYVNETVRVNGSNSNNQYGILLNGSDAYDAGLAWDRQPGFPSRQTDLPANNQAHAWTPFVINFGPFPAYHFFAPDDKTLYCELEITTGTFLRFGCGSLDLFSSSAPGRGRFFYGTGGRHPSASTSAQSWLGSDSDNASYAMEEVPFRSADYTSNDVSGACGSYLRVAHDSFDNWAFSSRNFSTTNTASICQGGGVHDRIVRELGPSALNGIGVLLPNVVALNRNNEYLNPVGVVPGMRYMEMNNYQPGDEFTIGSDVWKVFPWYQKGGRSGQRGIAMLKVV